jgi:DNA polymerase III subunit epsilon|tara:strand:- start:3843 stop:4517 length:675 start_codon:yes stop_codon:yes gene_type:complete
MNEIFLDTETTGLSVNDRHKIVEIACIETRDLLPTKRIFHKAINPQRDVPEEAFKVHGFSTEFLRTKETFDKVADSFLEFIKDKKIIIHNASFDLSFLNYELKLIRKNEIKKDNIVDSLEVARNKFPGSSNSLDALCRRFNIDLSRREKHNALLDCELLREVYINLLDVREPKLIFSNESADVVETNSNNLKKKDYCKIIIEPSQEELKLHKEFLKKELKKNYY